MVNQETKAGQGTDAHALSRKSMVFSPRLMQKQNKKILKDKKKSKLNG